MALTTLPYPSLDFVPLDILTAEEMNQIVANYTAINNATIGTNQLADSSITTSKLANKAVTSDKVDWATLSHVSSVGPSSATSVYQTPITLNEVTIPKTGVYFASATVDPNVLGNDVGNSTVYLALNSKNIAGAQVFFNSKSGMWFFGGCHVSAIISCSQGDKIQLRGECGQNHWEVGERRRLDAFRIG